MPKDASSLTDLSHFAWQGFEVRLPTLWSPGSLKGDVKAGSVRFDDRLRARMELEWKEAPENTRVSHIVDRYVESLARAAKKDKSHLQVTREGNPAWLQLGEEAEYFTWDSAERVHTVALFSSASNRLVFLRVYGEKEEKLGHPTSDIFNSLTDTEAGSPRRWSLFGLDCVTPPNFSLETYALKSGHIRLEFERDRTLLQFDRFSLAEMLLKDSTLEEWYREFFRKDLRNIDITSKQSESSSGESLQIAGRPKSRWKGLLVPLPFWNVRPRLNLDARVWSSTETNKIHAVHAFWKNAEELLDIEEIIRGRAPSPLEGDAR